MKNATLRAQLETFCTDVALALSMATRDGAEVPFEVVRSTERGGSLYCYRPLTGDFIRDRLDELRLLGTYTPAARALELSSGLSTYLRARGEGRVPDAPRDRADAALRCFLTRMFADRSQFAFDAERFEVACGELEHCLSEGLAVTEVVAPLLGLALDGASAELALATGLTVMRQERLEDPPAGLVDGMAPGQLLVLTRVPQQRSARPPLAEARVRFRQLLTALRLYERGCFAIGPIGFHRADAGVWTPVAIGPVGRVGVPTQVPAAQEDELRGFINLIGRRLESLGGEVGWALARFEFGSERRDPYESLTDYLLALRALLEPEGTASGRLAQRLAVICAGPAQRTALAERAAAAIALETAAIAGRAGDRRRESAPEALVDEMADHLRAILRDILCGHLDADVRAVADDLLAEAATRV